MDGEEDAKKMKPTKAENFPASSGFPGCLGVGPAEKLVERPKVTCRYRVYGRSDQAAQYQQPLHLDCGFISF